MYSSPVVGLKDIGCQLYAPMAPGIEMKGAPVLSYSAAGTNCGRPLTGSSPLAQFTVAKAWPEMNCPVFASST
jgi:hypothetical protein